MKVVGILGGGQLARMTALAGHAMGLRFRVFDPAPDASAAVVAEHVCSGWDDEDAIARFCDGIDVATIELEALPLATARAVAARVPMQPSPRALAACQDRLAEKELAGSLGLGTARYARIDKAEDLGPALERVGFPALLKHRTDGYDGRGQAMVRSLDEAREAWHAGGCRPSVLEGFVRFERELSQVAVRSRSGEVAYYPLVENLHEGGVLRRSIAPAPGLRPDIERQAREAARRVLEALDYVGVITLEFFEADGRLLLNEMAPRVHNSGHWTIEGAATSQFENHLRAVTGLPLGATDARGWSLLRNILGDEPDPARVLAIPDAHLHLYDKRPRAGRKLGHVTLTADSLDLLHAGGTRLQQALEGEGRE